MHCLTCGYNLKQLTEQRCPECGRAFDPEDRMTWGFAKTPLLLRGAWLFGWFGSVISFGVFGTATVGIASGRHDSALLIWLWMYALFPIIVLCVSYITCRAICMRPPTRRPIIIALVLLFLNLSLLTEWPAQAMFLSQRTALNRSAQVVLKNPDTTTTPLRIGPYTVHDAYSVNDGKNKHVIFAIDSKTGSPSYLVYGMTNQDIEKRFNTWSWKRLDRDWHIVHED